MPCDDYPAGKALAKLIANADRENIFVNAPNGEANYVTSGGRLVETLPHYMTRIKDRYLKVRLQGEWASGMQLGMNDVVEGLDGKLWIATGSFTTSSSIDQDIANGNLSIWNASIAEGILYSPSFFGGVTQTVGSRLEKITLPTDTGATGDGITNDTQAFTNLEVEIFGRTIDLCGRTYAVDSLPTKNIYTNGTFIIAGQKIVVRGLQRSPSSIKYIVMADSQPGNAAQLQLFRNMLSYASAVDDDADSLHFLGDLLEWGSGTINGGGMPYYYPDFLADVHKLPIPPQNQFFIAGNHDMRLRETVSPTPLSEQWRYSFYDFLQSFPRQNYYTLRGNILHIYLSTMSRNPGGTYPDYVVDWLKTMVGRNQDKVIFVFAHYPVGGTGLSGDYSYFTNYQRVTEWLGTEGYKVDVWFSGHSGDHLTDPSTVDHVVAYNCMHVSCDANIADNEADASAKISYVTIEIDDFSNRLHFKRQNVSDRDVSKEWTFDAHAVARTSDVYTHDGRHNWNDNYGFMNGPLFVRSNMARVQSATDPLSWEPKTGFPEWMISVATEDLGQDNVAPEQGTGMLFYVPGANSAGSGSSGDPNEPTLDRAYGVGGGIGALRTGNDETDYAAHVSIYCSGSGQAEDSLKEFLRAYPAAVWIMVEDADGNSHRVTVSDMGNITTGSNSSSTAGSGAGAALTSAGTLYLRTDGSASRRVVSFANNAEAGTQVVGSIFTDGSTTIYATSSDYRRKKNIEGLDRALEQVMKLRPVRFHWVAQEDADPQKTVGLIAHEAQEVLPEAVMGGKDAVDSDGIPVYQEVDYSKFIPLLIGAYQELVGKMNDIAKELEATKERQE